MKPIAHIHTDLPQKFGIPRNSFLAPHLEGRIVFEPEFASSAAVEGLDSFSHLWLLWRFENGTPGGAAEDIAADAKTQDRSGTNAKWSKTVRPPRLGGAERVGVFATRSPFRPNPIGLTCVKLDHVGLTDDGPIIHVLGPICVTARPSTTLSPTFRLRTATRMRPAAGLRMRRGKSSTLTSRKRCRRWSRPRSSPGWSRSFAKIRAARVASTSQTAFTTWLTLGSTYPLRLTDPS
nr:SAM-dependent methyltransferase [Collinsella sp. AF29-7AC]